MHAIVGEFGFKTIFPKDVLEETEAIEEVISNNEIKSRKDFRDVTTFTIDPADAKDFDDAISYRELENGNVKIGVHIADVSHYVKVGTPLDREAFERGTSVYLVDRTIPMLPEKLSNNLCSLRPNENRLAFSVEFELNAQFQIVNKWIGKTIIHSNRRFSYEEAQDIIVAQSGEYAHELVTLNNISKIYEKDRFEDGALKFESKELRFKLTESGEPIEVYEKTRFDAHKMIETYMLLANKAIAEHVYKLKIPNLPFIYRTHDNPPQEKLIEFAKFCKIMGYPIQIDNEKVMRKSFNSLLERAENKPELSVLQQMAIRTMAKAVYTAYKTSHFGLAFEYYTHFTSPIRRYPDLLAHRMLFEYLNNTPSPYNEETIESFAKHSSLMEQKAAEAERASVKYKMAELMKKHEGEIFEARISGITEWGIYATILDLHAEGLIKVSEIKFDRFYYVEDERKLMGKRTKRSFHMGDIITIKVKSANPIARQIDFYLYE
jgi:ribonuclease R